MRIEEAVDIPMPCVGFQESERLGIRGVSLQHMSE